MTVNCTDAALGDLRAIESYIATHSAQYAASMIDRLFDRSQELERLPRLGPVVPEYGDEALRELLEHPYRIASEDQIDVAAVVHSARQMPRGL